MRVLAGLAALIAVCAVQDSDEFDSSISALDIDDECQADGSEDRQCALSALQRRSLRLSAHHAVQLPIQEEAGDDREQTPGGDLGAQAAPPQPGAHKKDVGGCSEHPGYSYKLNWQAAGQSFFDGFNFEWQDDNHGAAEYLDKGPATSQGVAEAHPSHAILRAGATSAQYKYKRASAKIATTRTWKYFLTAMRYSHLPYGCGVWPAFWTRAPGASWPDGGELDILEYVNESPQQTSFHTGNSNRCKLNAAEVNRCGQMPDANRMNYDCVTAYPHKLGCAPNMRPLMTGEQWARRPGVIAVEWTETFLKVFYLPDGEAQREFAGDAPQPDAWDRFIISYYPFTKSNDCPNPADILAAQQLVLNINFCGDWASKVWKDSTCSGRTNSCRAVDPLSEYAPAQDCCTQFIFDGDKKHGSDMYLKERAYFNISWIKVYQH